MMQWYLPFIFFRWPFSRDSWWPFCSAALRTDLRYYHVCSVTEWLSGGTVSTVSQLSVPLFSVAGVVGTLFLFEVEATWKATGGGLTATWCSGLLHSATMWKLCWWHSAVLLISATWRLGRLPGILPTFWVEGMSVLVLYCRWWEATLAGSRCLGWRWSWRLVLFCWFCSGVYCAFSVLQSSLEYRVPCSPTTFSGGLPWCSLPSILLMFVWWAVPHSGISDLLSRVCLSLDYVTLHALFYHCISADGDAILISSTVILLFCSAISPLPAGGDTVPPMRVWCIRILFDATCHSFDVTCSDTSATIHSAMEIVHCWCLLPLHFIQYLHSDEAVFWWLMMTDDPFIFGTLHFSDGSIVGRLWPVSVWK